MPAAAGIDAHVHTPADSARLDEECAQADSVSDTVLVNVPDITLLLAEYLSIQGFGVTTAGSGAEALERLDVDQPDAILLDVRMPGMDGIETLRQIRARGTAARVLMVSANDDMVLAKLAMDLGAFDYLLKPVDFGYLSRALEQITSRPAPSSQSPTSAPEAHTVSCYELALEICRLARAMRPEGSACRRSSARTRARALAGRSYTMVPRTVRPPGAGPIHMRVMRRRSELPGCDRRRGATTWPGPGRG